MKTWSAPGKSVEWRASITTRGRTARRFGRQPVAQLGPHRLVPAVHSDAPGKTRGRSSRLCRRCKRVSEAFYHSTTLRPLKKLGSSNVALDSDQSGHLPILFSAGCTALTNMQRTLPIAAWAVRADTFVLSLSARSGCPIKRAFAPDSLAPCQVWTYSSSQAKHQSQETAHRVSRETRSDVTRQRMLPLPRTLLVGTERWSATSQMVPLDSAANPAPRRTWTN